MKRLQRELSQVIARDPDVASFGSFFGSGGGNTLNTGRFFIGLKPRDQRTSSALQVINRLRPQLAKVQGAKLFLQPSQDITVGGKISRGQFQYTLQDANLEELDTWAPRMLAKLKTLPELADVSTDQQGNAPQLQVTINRDAPRASASSRRPSTTPSTTPSGNARWPIFHPDQLLLHRARGVAGPAAERRRARQYLREGAGQRPAGAACRPSSTSIPATPCRSRSRTRDNSRP